MKYITIILAALCVILFCLLYFQKDANSVLVEQGYQRDKAHKLQLDSVSALLEVKETRFQNTLASLDSLEAFSTTQEKNLLNTRQEVERLKSRKPVPFSEPQIDSLLRLWY